MNQPRIRALSRGECEQILSRNHVGRLAYAWKNHVDIEPLHYVFDGEWLYGRTSRGTKLVFTGEQWWPVAFEVDEVEGLFQWRSVVVHGRIVFPDARGTPDERAQYARGVELFRTLVPDAFTENDPTPARRLAFVLHINDITGRAATSGSGTP